MANGQIVALVAVSISVVSIGLLFAVNSSLQSDLRNLNNNLVQQSEQIKSLNSELQASQEVIESQKTSIAQLQSELTKTNEQLLKQNDEIKSLTQLINSMHANITLMQDRIKLLDDRITLLEQILKQPHCVEECPPPQPIPQPKCIPPGPVQQFSKTKGLVAEWKFEGNTLDSSGNGNHGAICGDVTFVDGKIGRALSFDGISGVVLVPNSPTFNFGSTGSFSISLWLKSTQSGPGNEGFGWVVDHRRNNDGVYAGYTIGDSSGTIVARIRDSSAHDVPVSSTTNVNDGRFHHVVYVVDRSTQVYKLYIDNTLQATDDTSSVGSIDTAFDLHLGGTAYPDTLVNFYKGILDQVRIYNYALTTTEISSLYKEELQK